MYANIDRHQSLERGVFDFGNGHSSFWGTLPIAEELPLYLYFE